VHVLQDAAKEDVLARTEAMDIKQQIGGTASFSLIYRACPAMTLSMM
jgi:hypothetical protein